MARCLPVTDTCGDAPAGESYAVDPASADPPLADDLGTGFAGVGHCDAGDADLGWRSLAGSLDDLGIAPPLGASSNSCESEPRSLAPLSAVSLSARTTELEPDSPSPALPGPDSRSPDSPGSVAPASDALTTDSSDPLRRYSRIATALSITLIILVFSVFGGLMWLAYGAAALLVSPLAAGCSIFGVLRWGPRRAVLLVAPLVLGFAIFGGCTITLVDKATVAPGTLADIEQFVDIRDHLSYPSEATISLVSVRANFAPSLFEIVGGWLDDAVDVVDIADILGDRTVAENRDAGRLQMDQSTQVAVGVALEHLGYEVLTPVGARVEYIVPDGPADQALRLGDIVQAVNDTPVTTAEHLSSTIKADKPGANAALLVLDPDGRSRTVNVTLAGEDGVAFLGVIITTHVEFQQPPFEVRLNVDNIGGPSAGLAFTLSVIDALTPQPLTGTLDVAATGTIRHDGTVGTIGSITQKSHAAVRAGTDLFLVPASQADEAAAVAEPSVTVVGVESLEDALAAIAAHLV